MLLVFQQGFHFIRLLNRQIQRNGDIELSGVRQVEATGNTANAIFYADKEIPAFFLNVGEHVKGFITAISQKENAIKMGTVYHADQSTTFISFSSLLKTGIHIYVLHQIVECVQMKQIVGFLLICSREEKIGIIRISSEKKIRAIDG